MIVGPGSFLRALFDAALAASDPGRALAVSLPAAVRGRTVVVGAGKASAAMARAFEAAWPGPLEGSSSPATVMPCPVSASRSSRRATPCPTPPASARRGASSISPRGLGPDDQLVCLISGGGSALLALPAPGLTLADKQQVTRALLRSGATISEINTVRKHLSAIKGGRLAAAAAPARVVTLAISDVPGDDPAVIASGPTVPDPSTFADARAVLAKYRIGEPASVIAHLAAAADETPKPDDAIFARARYTLIASPQQALRRRRRRRTAAGVAPIVLSDRIEGEARDIGLMHAAIALQLARRTVSRRRRRGRAPGGVVVGRRDHGDGARPGPRRTQQRVPAVARGGARRGRRGIAALACDTDGIDGTEDNAGAILLPDSIVRAAACGVSIKAALAENDAYGFFRSLGDLIVTGPTLTNVNDFRAILVQARPAG